MNGRDLAEPLQGFSPQLKCLFMSGYTIEVVTARGLLDPGDPFIQKPFTRKELAGKIRAVLADAG